MRRRGGGGQVRESEFFMRGDEITRASIKRRGFIPGLTKRANEHGFL